MKKTTVKSATMKPAAKPQKAMKMHEKRESKTVKRAEKKMSKKWGRGC